MRTMRACALLALACAALLAAAPGRAAEAFPLQEGDTWVMAGDSITAQHLHSNYFEAFCYARYPKMTFRFRNSGVGGDTIPKVLARFDWDVAPWKPTVVSVELGMNDKGGSTTEQYLANMGQLAQKIQSVKARPVFFAASPVNNGSTLGKPTGGNDRLHEYATALKPFAAEQKAPYADQFHALIDVWGKNKPRENLANSINQLKALAQDDKLDGVEDLRKFLAAQAKAEGAPVSMMGDAVHPGPTGQLMMAAALLKELGANGFVSSVSIDKKGMLKEAKGCEITGIKWTEGKLEFDRTDEALAFPIPDEARPVLALCPEVLELSLYTLKVPAIAEACQVKINGKTVGVATAEELWRGVNLTRFADGPIAAQGKEVLAAVDAKEKLVGQWRNQSKVVHAPKPPEGAEAKLAELTKQVEEADAKIREAAKPRKLHFELVPTKE